MHSAEKQAIHFCGFHAIFARIAIPRAFRIDKPSRVLACCAADRFRSEGIQGGRIGQWRGTSMTIIPPVLSDILTIKSRQKGAYHKMRTKACVMSGSDVVIFQL
jgi:hypothetical protein